MTALGTVSPATKLRLLAVGTGCPQGKTVTNPGAWASVAVTLRLTVTAFGGIPARPATWSSVTEPAPRGPAPASEPSIVGEPGRVSSTRAGVSALYSAPVGKKPLTSTMRCVGA